MIQPTKFRQESKLGLQWMGRLSGGPTVTYLGSIPEIKKNIGLTGPEFKSLLKALGMTWKDYASTAGMCVGAVSMRLRYNGIQKIIEIEWLGELAIKAIITRSFPLANGNREVSLQETLAGLRTAIDARVVGMGIRKGEWLQMAYCTVTQEGQSVFDCTDSYRVSHPMFAALTGRSGDVATLVGPPEEIQLTFPGVPRRVGHEVLPGSNLVVPMEGLPVQMVALVCNGEGDRELTIADAQTTHAALSDFFRNVVPPALFRAVEVNNSL